MKKKITIKKGSRSLVLMAIMLAGLGVSSLAYEHYQKYQSQASGPKSSISSTGVEEGILSCKDVTVSPRGVAGANCYRTAGIKCGGNKSFSRTAFSINKSSCLSKEQWRKEGEKICKCQSEPVVYDQDPIVKSVSPKSFSENSVVEITGERFGENHTSEDRFTNFSCNNNIPRPEAQILSWTDSKITIKVPAKPYECEWNLGCGYLNRKTNAWRLCQGADKTLIQEPRWFDWEN